MPTETQPDPWKQDSNWLLCYVVIILIPIIFVCIAAFSVWRDRRTSRKYDIEAVKSTYAKYWSGYKDDAPPPSTRPTQYSQAIHVPMQHVNRVGPRMAGGFPAAAPPPPQYPQRPMVEEVSPRTVPMAPAWTGRDSAASYYSSDMSGLNSPKGEGHGPWVRTARADLKDMPI
ncbi:hypothetical protein BKA67DRAFT_538980 [Truncatella angustata]|uniref:Uncharacterized protein n=1 Tax=Truncatella angustata TaxID=152316 RepID=A0A9P8UFD8_9PEZI|nr:uncharacterized protein BKA67DRAFT_538980 [Truncatella angustata]KAH6648975.1 hypothetical protein BKA67DRAFT_538980 [Truncatella angustata]KAH8200748.1 hypothetical protein TruAng_005065 [Truncatella angustata]